MNPFEEKETLRSFCILVDTREKPTERAKRRYGSFGVKYERTALPYGDYQGAVILPDGSAAVGRCVIERKESLTELSGNFTHGRERFIREFERAQKNGVKIYLLVENASWENLLSGKYRTRFSPVAFAASVIAFTVRYNAGLIFCKEETSGRLIREILYRDIKDCIERGIYDKGNNRGAGEGRNNTALGV